MAQVVSQRRSHYGSGSSGKRYAAGQLITLLREKSLEDTMPASHWAAAQVGLDDPGAVSYLLPELREAGTDDAVATLLARYRCSGNSGSEVR